MSVTVPVEPAPPIKLLGDNTRVDAAGGFTVSVVVFPVP